MHKVYCFGCGQTYDQTTEKAPYCCGLCSSIRIGVYSEPRKPLDVSAGPNWDKRHDSPRD